MPNINFKVSDGQKFDFLFNLLNPNFNEEGGWAIENVICDVYDEYAIVRNLAEGIFERVYYTKDDVNDSLEITNKERCYIVDVNENEKNALDNIKGESTYEQVVEAIAETAATIISLNAQIGTYTENVNNLTSEVETLTEQNSTFSTQIEELNTTISTLTVERDEANTNYANVQAEFEALQVDNTNLTNELATMTADRDALATYKKTIETNAKTALIENYTEFLSEEVIETYMNNLDNYTIEDLDMKLTYEQKKANPSLFSKQGAGTPSGYVPKEDNGTSSIKDILSRYERH